MSLRQAEKLMVLTVLRVPGKELLQENSGKLCPGDLSDVSAWKAALLGYSPLITYCTLKDMGGQDHPLSLWALHQ